MILMAKKRKKNNNSKTGLTPPNKTTTKMAASTNQNQNITEILNQAHQFLHGSYTEVGVSLTTYQPSNHSNQNPVNSPLISYTARVFTRPLQQSTTHYPDRHLQGHFINRFQMLTATNIINSYTRT